MIEIAQFLTHENEHIYHSQYLMLFQNISVHNVIEFVVLFTMKFFCCCNNEVFSQKWSVDEKNKITKLFQYFYKCHSRTFSKYNSLGLFRNLFCSSFCVSNKVHPNSSKRNLISSSQRAKRATFTQVWPQYIYNYKHEIDISIKANFFGRS